ncbi:MAG: hypothetical protein K5882_09930 [Bacteroidales bacterium]|jgi:hypothetical protein|nr:hypothetical protein [Bacteroidales bacterium]
MENKNKLPIIIAALVAVVVLAVVLLVCSSKSHKIKNLEKFTAQVEQEYQNYSQADLEKSQAKFEKYVAKVEKKKLTGDETSHVNQLKGECKGYFAQAKARMILQDFNDAVEEAGDEVKGVIESLK